MIAALPLVASLAVAKPNKLGSFGISCPDALPTEFFGFGKDMEAIARIQILKKLLERSADEIDVDSLKTTHQFAPNQYVRTLEIPAGTLLVGKIHKFQHVNVISKGRCIVATFEGESIVEAPATFISPAGTQRAIYFEEDTVWTVVHNTKYSKESELELIEAEQIALDYSDPALPVTINH